MTFYLKVNICEVSCKAAVIYEGTRDIHTLMQADWALGLKKEKPARKTSALEISGIA